MFRTHLSFLVGLALFFGAGCTRKAFLSEENVFYYGNEGEPKDIDPHLTTGVPESRIEFALFEGLVTLHPKTLEPGPGTAEKWKVSEGGKTWTFYLRKNAKWSNGDPVTAHDFVYSWRRLLDPKTASEYAYQGYYFVNGKAINEGKIKDLTQLGARAIDDYTLEARLNNPTPFFLGLLFHHSLYAVPRKAIEKHGARWTRPENMVGNGAFILAEWNMYKSIVLKPNPHYWDRANVKLKEAHMMPIESLDTEEKMFRSGKIHITSQIPLEKIEHWKKDKTGMYQSGPYLGTYFYWMNIKRPPLTDKRVRKALNLAIDRERIVKYVTRGGQIPGTIFTPPGAGGFQPKSRLPAGLSRVAEAKKLLAEAGFPNGEGLPPIEILYNTMEGHKKIAEAVQEMLKENLGVQITLFNQEWKVYLDTMRQMQFQLSRQGWIADYNDPNSFLDILVSDSGINRSGWANPKYDELIQKAGRERNQQARLAIFQQAEDLMAEEAPVLPIYIYTRNYLKRPEVHGWYPNVQDIHPLKSITVDGRK